MKSDQKAVAEITRRTTLAAGAAGVMGAFATPSIAQSSTSAGFSATGLAQIQPGLERSVAAGGVPGIIAMIWRRGEIVQVNTAGYRDVDKKLPMERTTIVRAASMSKPVTVATALTLVDEGKMKLSDPITRWAPEFANMRVLKKPDGPVDDTVPASRALTIEDLMTHRAGMPYPFAQDSLARLQGEKIGTFPLYSSLSPDEWMKAMAFMPLANQPGERFNYGLAIDVLGVIVGRAAGTGLRQTVLDRICGPLGMKDTDFWIPAEKRDRQVPLYAADQTNRTFLPVPMPVFDGPAPWAFVSGGGGLVTTADDYLAFARMLLHRGEVNGKQLLKRETAALMTTNRLTPAQRQIPVVLGPGVSVPTWKTQGFGLGVSMITDPQGYAAGGAGAGSAGAFTWAGIFGGWWQADPEQDMVLIWLTQEHCQVN